MWLGCEDDTLVEVGGLCKKSHYRQLRCVHLQASKKYMVLGWVVMKGNWGLLWVAMGLLAWHCRSGSREDRCQRHDMIVRQKAQLGAFVAGLQQLFHSCCDPMVPTSLERLPAEAAVHLWGRLRPCLEVTLFKQTFLWLQISPEQTLSDTLPLPSTQLWQQSCCQRKGGHLFVLLCFLCCLNCTFLKPKEMHTDVNMYWKTRRSCSADHWGSEQMVPSVIPFLMCSCTVSLLPPQLKSRIAHIWELESRSQMSSL